MIITATIHALHALGAATVIAVVGASGLGIFCGIRRLTTGNSSSTN